MELVALHRDAPVPPLAEIRDDAPGILESTATAALAKDPADRPQDGRALLAALGVPAGAGFTTTSGGLADPDATRVLPAAAAAPPPGPRPPRRHRRIALMLSGLLVLAMAGSALAYELTRTSGSTQGDRPPTLTVPKQTTQNQTTPSVSTSAPASTAASTSTAQTTTFRPTTQQVATTPAPPPPATTVAPPPTTTAPPATTDTTLATTTTPPTTTAGAGTTTP
jgi:hypothetical protein